MFLKSRLKKTTLSKYVFSILLVLGLCNALANTELSKNKTAQELDDVALIKKVQAEIDREVFEFGSVKDAYFNTSAFKDMMKPDEIPTKEQYFKAQLFANIFYNSMYETIDENGKKKTEISISEKIELPTSAQYESFVNYKKTFQVLDRNLKYSISAYSSEVLLLNKTEEYPEQYTAIKVANTRDLTGDEIRNFNSILDDISKNNKIKNILLTDDTYTFHIYQKQFIRIEAYEMQEIPAGQVLRNKNTITLSVNDVENLTIEESKQKQTLITEISTGNTFEILVITDGKFKTIMNTSSVTKQKNLNKSSY